MVLVCVATLTTMTNIVGNDIGDDIFDGAGENLFLG